MRTHLVFITYNRIEYTKKSLPSLLADNDTDFELTLWDNASTDGTQDFLDSIHDSRIKEKIYSKENVRLNGAANACFSRSEADLVGIAENDFIYRNGWIKTLAQAHKDIPQLGKVSGWHLGEDLFTENDAKHKIQSFNGHRILRHPYTGGGCGLIKLNTWKKCGPFESSATTSYWMRMAQSGYVNGWYYPLIHLEHMDYPWSSHFAFTGRTEEWLAVKANAKRSGIRNASDAKIRHKRIVKEIIKGPWEVKYYIGWRGKVRNVMERLRTKIRFY